MIIIVNGYLMCLEAKETVHHLLIHCQSAYRVWMVIINMFEMEWVMPRIIEDLFLQQCFGCKCVQGKILWKSMLYATLSKLWWEKNNRVFRSQSKEVGEVVESIVWTVSEWVCRRKEFDGVSLDDHNRSCTACLSKVWYAKFGYRACWKSPPNGFSLS